MISCKAPAHGRRIGLRVDVRGRGRGVSHCHDAEKALFAARVYERAFIVNIRPSLDAPLLQKEFARVVEGRGFDPGYFTNSTAAKTTPTTTRDTAPIRT
jgi:hypothetical protein